MRQSVDKVNLTGGETPGDVLESIHQLMHLVRAHRQRALRTGAHELTHMEGKVLAFFARHPGATQRDLAEHMVRDKGQLGRLVAGLRERELLAPADEQPDRRSLRLEPTAQARTLLQGMQRHSRSLAALAVNGIGADERKQLLALLARVRANLDTAD